MYYSKPQAFMNQVYAIIEGMKPKTAEEVLQKIKEDYQQIAESFSATRQQSWKEFDAFQKYVKKGMTVADIGCGNGRLLRNLPSNVQYIGIDLTERLLEKARKKYPSGQFLKGDILHIPLENESIDITFCIAVLHHIPSKELREKAVQELKRITKRDGKIILMVWNLWQKKYFLQIIKALLEFFRTGRYDWNDFFIPWGGKVHQGGKVHRYYHAFTKKEFLDLLKKNFSCVKWIESPFNFCVVCQNE